jgi:hypothetical protein
MKKPNFLIIGAARSGTTTLVHYLNLHPHIFFPETEHEPKFFSREPEYEKGVTYYLHTYFSSADKYQAVGEKSTEYMESSRVAERIYRFNPHIKLIVILRNPVERMLSNYWWSVSNGLETRNINEAIKTEFETYLQHPEPVSQIFAARPHAYVDRSVYYDNLLPFYRFFAKEQITCLLFEEFFENQQQGLKKLFTSLGVECIDVPINAVGKQRSIKRTDTIDPHLYEELTGFFSKKNKRLVDLTGLNVARWYD